MDFIEFITRPSTKYFFVPLITVLLGSVIKIISENDRFSKLSREWFYWGPNLVAGAFLTVFLYYCSSVEMAVENQDIGGINNNALLALLFCFLGTIIVPLLIRKKGWSMTSPYDKRLNWWWGIIIPDLIGFILLYGCLKLLT